MIRLDDLPADEYEYDDMSLSLHGKYNHYTIGDSVEVVVAATNTKLRRIDFTLAGVEPNNNNILIKKKNVKSEKTNKNKIKNSKKSSKNSKKSSKSKKKRK